MCVCVFSSFATVPCFQRQALWKRVAASPRLSADDQDTGHLVHRWQVKKKTSPATYTHITYSQTDKQTHLTHMHKVTHTHTHTHTPIPTHPLVETHTLTTRCEPTHLDTQRYTHSKSTIHFLSHTPPPEPPLPPSSLFLSHLRSFLNVCLLAPWQVSH